VGVSVSFGANHKQLEVANDVGPSFYSLSDVEPYRKRAAFPIEVNLKSMPGLIKLTAESRLPGDAAT
jgi:hypothetical protein